MGKYTYLFLDFITILFPICMSFEKKIFFFAKWKFAFAAMLVVGLIFLVWDSFFTYLGVWGFNSDYILGVFIYNLPLEEVLFFITVPFSCLFIYECVDVYLKQKYTYFKSNYINIFFIILLISVGCINTTKLYSAFAFIGSGLYLTYNVIVTKSNYLAQFWITIIIVLIPFFIVNSILTGTFLESPVVWYNGMHNIGARIGTIPIEDLAYNLLMLLMCVTFYERFKKIQLN